MIAKLVHLKTPGRLLDLHDYKACNLSMVEILVLDEVDELLNLGFQEEMEEMFCVQIW